MGENLAGTRRLVERYRALGLTVIETRYYTGARHELLNETNRDEAQRDVLAWLAKTVGLTAATLSSLQTTRCVEQSPSSGDDVRFQAVKLVWLDFCFGSWNT